jgi:hypothetical protein
MLHSRALFGRAELSQFHERFEISLWLLRFICLRHCLKGSFLLISPFVFIFTFHQIQNFSFQTIFAICKRIRKCGFVSVRLLYDVEDAGSITKNAHAGARLASESVLLSDESKIVDGGTLKASPTD